MEQLLMFVISLTCLIVFFMMASNLSAIAKSSRNTEAILKRLLELEKERSNESKRAEQLSTTKDEFPKYKPKI